jgi:23S rRNA (cytidine1920-2'-O)/16S rRNA (cytidine1409-2'-O)-methyltransferase
MAKKCRLDQLLVERGLVETRTKAQALVRAGDVFINGERRDKPGMSVPIEAEVVLRARPVWVGRGALKLDFALAHFELSPDGLVCLDVGASTGGFTEVLLARGASRVYAVDVGRAQLAWKLRNDPRVINLERTDIRALEALPVPPALASVDVAFISLRAVLPAIAAHCLPGSPVVALVKPQFEAGRSQVGKGGIVRDEEVHRQVLREVMTWALARGWALVAAAPSPVLGGAGNREFLLQLRTPTGGHIAQNQDASEIDPLINALIEDATAPAAP